MGTFFIATHFNFRQTLDEGVVGSRMLGVGCWMLGAG